MKRLVATGRCKTDEHVRALLKYLGIDQREADHAIRPGISRLEVEGGILSFTDAVGESRLFKLEVSGDDVVKRMHSALTESTMTHTFDWRCHISREQES